MPCIRPCICPTPPVDPLVVTPPIPNLHTLLCPSPSVHSALLIFNKVQLLSPPSHYLHIFLPRSIVASHQEAVHGAPQPSLGPPMSHVLSRLATQSFTQLWVFQGVGGAGPGAGDLGLASLQFLFTPLAGLDWQWVGRGFRICLSSTRDSPSSARRYCHVFRCRINSEFAPDTSVYCDFQVLLGGHFMQPAN